MTDEMQPVDVCIVCALEEEAKAVRHEFSARCAVSFETAFTHTDRYLYWHTTITNKKNELLTLLLICQPRSGPVETAMHVKSLLHEFRPRFAAMTGICAGDKKKVKLGDLVVAEYAYHYEEGKVEIDKDRQKIHSPQLMTHGTAKRILQYAHNFSTWEEPLAGMKPLKMKREHKRAEHTKCLIAPMASGSAVRSDNPFPELRLYNRKTAALDMEAAAFYLTLHDFPDIYSLVVKGVCDYADMRKNDAYHRYAAHASAIYLLYFIREYVTEETMPRKYDRQSRTELLQAFNQKVESDEWIPPRDTAVLPLPPASSGLVGRAIEQQWLRDRLLEGKTTGVWAFAGMGGVGKTSLVADLLPKTVEEFPGGIGVIRANEITDPQIIIRQLVEKFVTNGPELLERGALTKAALSSRLSSTLTELRISGKRVLVAIDNVEAALIPKLKQLLDLLQAAQVSVVITSREELDSRLVDDSLEISVLNDEMAVELFGKLIYGKSRAIPSEEYEDILTICRITGNHAQALVLASADLKQRTFTTISDYRHHLESAPDAVLNLYDQLSTDVPGGVRLTFSSSYEHLNESTQQLFVALGTLSGPSCTVEAVLALGRLHDTRASLKALLKAKLIRESASNSQGVRRIELHPLVQQFARELLGKWPITDADEIRGVLAQHYSQWIEGKNESVLRADDLNLIAALEWARDHLPQSNLIMAELNFHLREYWQQRLQLEQATRWLPLGIDAMSHLDGPWPQRQADTTHALAAMYFGGGRMPEARGYYLQSLERFRKVGDRKGEGLALHSLGILAMQTSDPTGAKDYLTQSLEVRRQIGDRQGVGQALNSLGILFLDLDPPAAKPYLTESLEIRRELGEERNVALTLRSLGSLSKGMGDLEAARRYYTESLIVFRKIAFRRDEAITLQYLGVLLRDSDPASAREYYNDSLDILNETDDWKNKIASLYGLGFVHLNLNELEAAERYFNDSLEYCKRGADQRSEGVTLRGLGTLAEMQGDRDRAETCYREALALAKKVSFVENIARLYELLGALLLKYRGAAGKAEGCQMLGEAAATYKQMSRPEDAERAAQEASRLGCGNGNVSS